MLMKKLLMILLLVLLSSCCINNPLLDPSVDVHNSVHKEYIRYVNESDDLSDYQKAIRVRNVENYGRLLDELND